MGGSYYQIPCSVLSTEKDSKTPQRYPDVPITSWRISIRSMDSRTIDQSADGKLRDLNPEESWAILEDLALYDNESWNDPRDLAKPVKAIALPQDVPMVLVTLRLAWKTPNKPSSNMHLRVSIKRDDARQSRFEADFKQQQNERTYKINTVLKAITNQIAGTLPSDNPKVGTHLVLSACSHPTTDPQYSIQIHSSINTITVQPKQPKKSRDDVLEIKHEESNPDDTNPNPQPQPDRFASITTEQNEGETATTEEPVVEYFNTFPTRDELNYPRYLMSGPNPLIFLRNHIITEGCPHNLKIPCNIRQVHIEKAYIDLNSPLNIMTRMMYNWIMRRKLNPRDNANGGTYNFTGRIKGMHVFIENFTYVVDFMIVEDISSILDPRLSQVVLGKPFIEISNMTHDPHEGVVRFIRGANEVAYKMPYKIEQYKSLSDLEKEHTKYVYLRNEEDKRRGVEYVMNKVLGFYKECLELGLEYLIGVDEGEVT
ncbi:retrotransposon ORF1 [Tanacetum coccineum]